MQRLVALLLIASLSRFGWTQESEERGQFVIHMAGKKVGTEEWRVEKFPEGGTGVFAKTKLTIESKGNALVAANDTALKLDKDGRVATYAGIAKVNDLEQETRIEVKAGKAAIATKSGGNEATKEAKLGEKSHLLDNNCFIQIGLIARTYDAKKGRFYPIRIFAIGTLGELDASIDDRGPMRMTSGDKSVDVRHIIVNVGRLGISVYLRGDGRVAAVRNPMQGVTAYLAEYEGWVVGGLRVEIKRPDGVVESEVTFKSGGITLSGSFTRPRELKRLAAAVVLVSGSGPQDRDENVVGAKVEDAFQWSIFKSTAYELSAAGFGVLRYDDRGVAKSEGVFDLAKLSDFVADAAAAVAYLRTRDDVDPDLVGIVGHSEGGIVAPIVANKDARVRALFLMAGTGRPLDAVILQQSEAGLREQGVSEDVIARQLEKQRAQFAEIRTCESDWITIDERETFIGWLREHFEHDPAREIAGVKAAVVVFQGMKDAQVYPENAELLEKAMKGAGKENFEVRRYTDLDHLFMKHKAGIADYADASRRVDESFLRELATALGKWLR